jgi:ATP-dependent helicase/DNAse subunit B
MQGGSAEYYADACRYCDYRSICFLSEQDTGRIRRPLPQKEAKAAMLKIMNNNGEEVQENGLDTAAGSGD